MSELNHMSVEKPVQRSRLRSILGKEYFILKRRLKWLFGNNGYVDRPSANISQRLNTPFIFIEHRSLLLRPLKGVDMYLQHNKIVNLSLAVKKIDGVVIRPGQKMSVWKLVGRPSGRKGYLEGLVLHNGMVSKGTGGGLCQLGNLIYWMSLHTDLEVTQRWRHSYDVFPDINRTIPFACGATLAYNYIDLELTNNTPDNYSIHLWLDDEYLYGEIRCGRSPSHRYEIVETDHAIKLQWWGGYTRHNRIWKRRISLQNGNKDELLVAENHAIMMYSPLLEGGQTE